MLLRKRARDDEIAARARRRGFLPAVRAGLNNCFSYLRNNRFRDARRNLEQQYQ
jgi:hypothetical protein